MQVRANQFIHQLAQANLPNLILLFGDEPQQKMDIIDAIRARAKKEGFDERQSLVAESGFEWQQLIDATQAMSLFSDKQFIELTLPSGKPGAQGAATLTELAKTISDDTLLLIQGPKIGKDVQNAKWFKQVAERAWFCHCYELQGSQLNQWIKERANERKLALTSQAITTIAEMSEGNLLAANQEIEKLRLIFNEGQTLDHEQVAATIVDQSRFTVFQFTDEVLAGNMQKAVKILYRLESEGLEPNIILWSLVKEAQLLEQLSAFRARNETLPYQKLRIWQSKQSLYNSALMRLNPANIRVLIAHLQQADALFKSTSVQKPYVTLSHLALLFLPAPLEQFPLIA
uniref:DNA polymerase III subunit delta n=1 Tax=Ningiella ruwaisensis TaxID=2364274 RepID=UPI0010A05E8F|nr:DNA polymerase III subunit delta [Ningiella ruwaisensis]